MAHYINKDALVAEIERLEKMNHKSEYVYDSLDTEYTLKSILSFINKMEVKEVDLEKEVSIEWDKCNPIDEGMGCEFTNISIEQFYYIAKHFFELGFKAQKGE